MTQHESTQQPTEEIGFGWWMFQAWGNLVVGGLLGLGMMVNGDALVGFLLAAFSVWIGIKMVGMRRWAMIVVTVISLNPLLWIINWFYLKRRWDSPRIFENQRSPSTASEAPTAPDGPAPTVSAPAPATPQPSAATGTQNDDALYELAFAEVSGSDRRAGLWARCFAEANGDDNRARAAYITKRVEQLRTEEHS